MDYQIKNFSAVIMRIVNNYMDKKYGLLVFQNEDEVNDIIEENDFGDNIMEWLSNKGFSKEQCEECNSLLNQAKEGIVYTVQFFEEAFESLHDSIENITSQLHIDKIIQAKDLEKRFAKAMRLNQKNKDIYVARVLGDIENSCSSLVSDMTVRIDNCKKFYEEKQLFFGWLKVKKIRNCLKELKETLLTYFETVMLRFKVELYREGIENIQEILKETAEEIKRLFPYEESDNIMYKLTDEDFWIQTPKEYCTKLNEMYQQINNLN